MRAGRCSSRSTQGLRAIVLSAVWKHGASRRRRPAAAPACRRAPRRPKAIEPAARRLPAQLLDPARRRSSGRVHRLRGGSRPSAAGSAHRLRRQRAEPQPVLGAAVRPGRRRRRCGRVRAAARGRLRRAQERRPEARPSSAAVLAPRGGDDPGVARQTHSPTAFITDLGAAYRASGRTKPADGHVLDPRLRRVAQDPAVVSPSAHDVDRDRRLRQARLAARPSVRRHRAEGLEAPDRLRRVRRRDRRPGCAGVGLHRHRGRADGGRRRRRHATTGRRSSSRHARRTCARSTSSTCSTSGRSTACRAGCTTSTGRPSRAARAVQRRDGGNL